jgi:hypothetical protein
VLLFVSVAPTPEVPLLYAADNAPVVHNLTGVWYAIPAAAILSTYNFVVTSELAVGLLIPVIDPPVMLTPVCMSTEVAVKNTCALPDNVNALPPPELSMTLRDIVPTELLRVPVPISQLVPSSIVYRTVSPSAMPAAENDWYPATAEPKAIEPVPVVAVRT